MSGSGRLLDAMHKYDVNIRQYVERAEGLKDATGEERDRMQNELADWIEKTFPLTERKKPMREFSEAERNAVNVVFGDSLNTTIRVAGRNYEALEYAKTVDLYDLHLDVGYIDQPEDSDYRRLASWTFAYAYSDISEEEILSDRHKNRDWEFLQETIDQGGSIRIWYSENPSELCGFYYLCSLLKDYTGAVYAVRVPERISDNEEKKNRIVYMTGQIDSDHAGRIVESAELLSQDELRMYADEWERLKQENAPLRTVISGKIVSVGAGFYDGIILTNVPTEPTEEKAVFGMALSAMPYIHLGWLTWRIQRLIEREYIVVEKDNEDPSKRLIRRKREKMY